MFVATKTPRSSRVVAIDLYHRMLLFPWWFIWNNNNNNIAMSPSSNNKNKNKNDLLMKKNSNQHHRRRPISIVGPDCIQVLQGTISYSNTTKKKNVSLILCGESHQDAIDVTRRGGKFDAKEGWMNSDSNVTIQSATSTTTTTSWNNNNNSCCCYWIHVFATTTKKMLPLEKAKEWAKDWIESNDTDGDETAVVLIWCPDPQGDGRRVNKGKAYLLGLMTTDDDDGDNDDDEFVRNGYWKKPDDPSLPLQVQEWASNNTSNSTSSTGSSSTSTKAFEWGDLDVQAFALNRRRLSDEVVSTEELDEIVKQRKEKLKELDHIWTWDDWMDYQFQQNRKNYNNMEMHLILEASVVPWELELHRPTIDDDIHIGPAADCIRSVEEDEESEEEDDYDPSSDGVGSYLDFIYRRFMETQLKDDDDDEGNTPLAPNTNNDAAPIGGRPWLHCVDMRDLGCQGACHSESVQSHWKDLLTEEEHQRLLSLPSSSRDDSQASSSSSPFLLLQPDSKGEYIQFVPENRMNPERLYLESLRSEGKLIVDDDDDDDSDNDDDDDDEFTYPSFEGFFGQNTFFLYYSRHIKLVYSPFLAKCVKSLDTWDQFFSTLFLGGTISDALSLLQLQNDNKEYLYVRSPIHKLGDSTFRHRDDGEHYITYPFFPFLFYLHAKGEDDGEPPRTWSSNLFARLLHDEQKNGGESTTTTTTSQQIAEAAREWTLQKIHQSSLDPKGADDPDCGGEWFEGYLHAVHRDIYDDIDTSDTTALLKKNKMKSLTTNRKHNIGKIKVPSCKEGFEEILQNFETPLKEQRITPRTEIFAKIIIDVYMARLVDFATVLKIAEIVKESKEDKTVIVLYMGMAHTKAVSEFFVQHMSFRKLAFVGKVDWDEDECHKLELPKSLWDFSELFRGN
eukprot:scaffold2070_cov105-Cylindrotheca_fusiformis.AAC.5